jgi:hypothetical protein
MTAYELAIPAASVAAMQEQERNSLKIVAALEFRSNFGGMFARSRSIRFRLTGSPMSAGGRGPVSIGLQDAV